MRREFNLSESDTEHLNSLGHDWEAIVEGKQQWLLIHDWPTNAAYDPPVATLALHIVPGYPDNQLDMACFAPQLTLKSGKQVGGLTVRKLDGRTIQQWSRHRTRANPWRAGVDDLATHMLLVGHWLEREVA